MPKPSLRLSSARLAAFLIGALLPPPLWSAAAPAIDLAIEAEQFEFPGDWTVVDYPRASGGKCLFSGARHDLAAATAVRIPRAGRYHLWVRALDFPQDRPGTRRFTVSVGAHTASRVFGTSGQEIGRAHV